MMVVEATLAEMLLFSLLLLITKLVNQPFLNLPIVIRLLVI